MFFFSIAARTITALTVMRSGRKLRHLDIVGSHPKQKQTQKHKPNTNKNQTTPTKRLPKKARTKVKRCETCENVPPAQSCFHPFDLEDLHLGHHRQLVFASLGRYHLWSSTASLREAYAPQLQLFIAKVGLILSNGIFHFDLNRSNLPKVLVKRVLESFQNDPVCFRLQEVLLSIHFQQLYLL